LVAYKDLPDTLKPYHYHGVELRYKEKEKYAMGDCPWCGGDKKFGVRVESGLWKCWVCADGEKEGGNTVTFVRRLWELSKKQTKMEQYEQYAMEKHICSPQSLIDWGLAWNSLTRHWIAPGFGITKTLSTLYVLSPFKKPNGTTIMRWLPTPAMGMKIYGLHLFDTKKPVVYVCEGFNDGVALYEVLKAAKVVKEQLVLTTSVKESLLADANVIAIPGCGQWQPSWNKLIEGKEVRIMFDNDYPDPKFPDAFGAGYAGTIRTATLMYHESHKALSVEGLVWGVGGHEKSLPDGYDVRDCLRETT
jgi:hypothetical protein